MPRGSRPGERRGGRQRGTPNKSTLLKNAVYCAAASEPNRSPLDFMLALMRDPQVPIDARLDMAAAAAPFVHARPRPPSRGRPHPMELRARRGGDGGVPGSEENPALQPALAGGDEKPTFQPALPGREEKPTLQPALPGRMNGLLKMHGSARAMKPRTSMAWRPPHSFLPSLIMKP
jgi:hypothetical protein